jgi:cell division septal protein FtsQ
MVLPFGGLFLPVFADSIVQVMVEGNVHVRAEEIFEVVQTRAGDNLASLATADRIRDDFRAIFALDISRM